MNNSKYITDINNKIDFLRNDLKDIRNSLNIISKQSFRFNENNYDLIISNLKDIEKSIINDIDQLKKELIIIETGELLSKNNLKNIKKENIYFILENKELFNIIKDIFIQKNKEAHNFFGVKLIDENNINKFKLKKFLHSAIN